MTLLGLTHSLCCQDPWGPHKAVLQRRRRRMVVQPLSLIQPQRKILLGRLLHQIHGQARHRWRHGVDELEGFLVLPQVYEHEDQTFLPAVDASKHTDAQRHATTNGKVAQCEDRGESFSRWTLACVYTLTETQENMQPWNDDRDLKIRFFYIFMGLV